MSGSKVKGEIGVPEGWKLEEDGCVRDSSILTSPSNYFATIDWNERCFRSGITSTGARLKPRAYKGPGWRQILVNDAVKWLMKLERTT